MVNELKEALARVIALTKKNKTQVIRSEEMERTDRELLIRTRWLQEIIKGWYLLAKPENAGDSSIWYAHFWEFLRVYLRHRFGKEYCLSAENSLDLHTGTTIIPKKVIVISAKGTGPLELPFGTSIYVYKDQIPKEKIELQGLQIMVLSYALCRVSGAYFKQNPKDAEIALRLIRSSSELIEMILKHHCKNGAARLIGAYTFLGSAFAEELKRNLTEMGWKVKEDNPFTQEKPLLIQTRMHSSYVARILSMWSEFREIVIRQFPEQKGVPKKAGVYLERVEDLYHKDAYNSLSIEGYQVDDELIERAKHDALNADDRNALAARGYYEAFLEVKKSLAAILEGENPGEVARKDLSLWYQKLFSPFARAGIIREIDLIGYRKGQVYIRGSRHVPLPKEALIDAMDALFECLKNEKHAAVRAVLGHYIFVYIHPFMDGNGRIGRFLMNAMFASGGYPWTIIEVKNRKEYIAALETAGVENNIEPFAKFVASEMVNKRIN